MANVDKDNVIHMLFDLVPHTQASHHTPGELKLKLMFSALSLIKKIDLEALAEAIPGILGVKTKWLSGSVTIVYDPGQLPFDLLEDLLGLKENPDQEFKVMDSLREVINMG